MQILVSFSTDDVYRLFLTYHRNPDNYKKIKERVIGKNARIKMKGDMRGGIYFMIALTIIICVGSLYPLAMGDYSTVASLWVIWVVLQLPFVVWMIYLRRTSFKVLQQNEDFFSTFESKANQCETLQDFRGLWQPQTDF